VEILNSDEEAQTGRIMKKLQFRGQIDRKKSTFCGAYKKAYLQVEKDCVRKAGASPFDLAGGTRGRQGRTLSKGKKMGLTNHTISVGSRRRLEGKRELMNGKVWGTNS